MNTANKLTVLRMLLIPIFIAFFFIPLPNAWNMWLAAGVFILAAVTDVLDGHWARKHNQCTDFGRFLDPIADKLLTCSAFILLTATGQLHAIFTILFIGREFVISGFRLVAAGGGTVIAAGLMGKLKTTLQCVAIVLLMLDNPLFSLIHANFRMDWIVTGAALLASLWSCAEYVWKNRKMISFR